MIYRSFFDRSATVWPRWATKVLSTISAMSSRNRAVHDGPGAVIPSAT